MIINNFHPLAIVTLEIVSAAAVLGSFAGILPPLAAFGAVVWYVLQIWESKTVQHWLTKEPKDAPPDSE